ncbi:MAG TPA: FTR1 family protein [Vicinamibacteria bacterium]|nr:FTR1 family protein [Vicinamibacteria bacterium]
MTSDRLLPRILLFLPLFLGASLVFFPRAGATKAERAAPLASTGLGPEELLFLLQYVGTDYEGAVSGGEILDDFEYREMLEFTRILADEYPKPDSAVKQSLDGLRTMVSERSEPHEVVARVRELVAAMTQELHVVSYPSRAPSLLDGRRLYETACRQCHGDSGDGLGPSAVDMSPPPTAFGGERMRRVAPHQLFNAIGFGVAGTAMPSYDETLSLTERWDLAFYLMTMRESFSPSPPNVPLPITVKDLATRSDAELAQALGAAPGALDYYRGKIPETPEDELLRLAQRKLDESLAAYERGDGESAVRLSLEAYLDGIEPTEATLLATNARLVRSLERSLASYRASLRQGASEQVLAPQLARLKALTEEARLELTDTGSGLGFVFMQSATIILREGIEATLLIGLLLSYLTATGHREFRRYTLWGSVAGVLVGVLTWLAARFVVGVSTLQREALEGITSLLAAGVLFSVSFWVIHNADLKRWKSYIEDRAKSALGAGSGLALATVAFLAVYREAFESVLFYQALFLRHETAGAAIFLGLGAGVLLLFALVVLTFRYGKKIPLKPFFAVTGLLLGLLSFVFAGYGIRELQKIGWIKETPLPAVPYVPFLELQATVEGLALQIGILLSFLLAWFVSGAAQPKRGPEPQPAAS